MVTSYCNKMHDNLLSIKFFRLRASIVHRIGYCDVTIFIDKMIHILYTNPDPFALLTVRRDGRGHRPAAKAAPMGSDVTAA